MLLERSKSVKKLWRLRHRRHSVKKKRREEKQGDQKRGEAKRGEKRKLADGWGRVSRMVTIVSKLQREETLIIQTA